ncbi:hypothetical protein PHYPSEUDO_000884 [Phytophthora pseudosyringae]|uniref:RxLR effector protein n=1 Tax=Phytophthora pseudosyringae TaxID=221518 RepID=A0A8T1V3J2_9STRA|nr:hypothetical protein PHYPSEUDO_000884 [Phytophthora pseudosyringae]
MFENDSKRDFFLDDSEETFQMALVAPPRLPNFAGPSLSFTTASHSRPSFLQFAICLQARKSSTTQVKPEKMRISYVLLVAAATLLASGNALSTETEKRSLRSYKAAADQEEEERGISWIENMGLPEMFKKMHKLPNHQRAIFASWMNGMQSVDDAVVFMKGQGLSGNTLEHFKDAYAAYRRSNS